MTREEREIREALEELTTYRMPNTKTDLVSLKAVKRVLNLVFRGSRDLEPKVNMTREEAIEHGKEQLEVFGGEQAEFIKLAIEALEQAPDIDKVLATIDFEEKWLLEAGYNCSNVNTAFRSIKHDLRKLGRND